MQRDRYSGTRKSALIGEKIVNVPKSGSRTQEAIVMIVEGWLLVRSMRSDGTPRALKGACVVQSGGKDGDNFKVLPITIVDSSDFTAIE